MNIIDRFNAESPKFFKFVQLIGVIFAAIGGGILSQANCFPVWVGTVGGYLVATGGVAAFVAKFAVKNYIESTK
jgi:hypothetical protein